MSHDMSTVIVPKSDQVNAEDFLAGPITYEIESVEIRQGAEQPVSIRLVGENRVWRPCKSMSRVLVAAWGPDAKAYRGRSVTLYRDPNVKWGGIAIGGIRISHLSHIEREMLLQLTATKGKRSPHIVKPLVAECAPEPKQAPKPFKLDEAAADTAALGGVAVYKKFIASLPKDQQTPYTETEAHAMRRNRALTVDRLSACTDVIELEAEWDATPQEVRAAIGAEALDKLRNKLAAE